MNLYFLLEGRRSEPTVYRRWLAHFFPALEEVWHASDMTGNSFRLKSAEGYPNILQVLDDSVREVETSGTKLQHFFACLDAEEETYDDRYAELDTRLQKLSPSFPFTVIVQDCCLETWLLGNRSLFKAQPRTSALSEFIRFYDVSQNDPEQMPKGTGYETRAQFHFDYLRAVHRDRGLSYTKKRGSTATQERQYFEALVERWQTTNHLSSFGHLVRSWRDLGAQI